MASLNKVMLMGNLTKDAELRYLQSGQAVLEFRIAVTRKYRTQNGDDKEETCFVDVNLWGKRGEAVSQYLTKGKPLFVEGRLQLDEWDDKNTGEKRSKLRVVAENIEFIGGGAGRGGEGGGEPNGGAARGGFAGGGRPASAPQAAAGYGANGGGNGFGGGGPGGGYGGGPVAGGYGGGAAPYARPAAQPSQAAAMQVREDDIPF